MRWSCSRIINSQLGENILFVFMLLLSLQNKNTSLDFWSWRKMTDSDVFYFLISEKSHIVVCFIPSALFTKVWKWTSKVSPYLLTKQKGWYDMLPAHYLKYYFRKITCASKHDLVQCKCEFLVQYSHKLLNVCDRQTKVKFL